MTQLELFSLKKFKVGDRVWVMSLEGPAEAKIVSSRLDPKSLPSHVWNVQIEGRKSVFPYQEEDLFFDKQSCQLRLDELYAPNGPMPGSSGPSSKP